MSQGSRFLLSYRLSIQQTRICAGGGVLCLLMLSACAKPLVLDATLPQQVAEISCIDRCHSTKDRCDADARDDYRQCQAGYGDSFRAYRWCLASASDRDQCGYPWWSCAANLFGDCANRDSECERACRR
jgi:hypothetical protein